jgi:hypothetical protein
MNKLKINFKLHGLYYNNDKEAIKSLKYELDTGEEKGEWRWKPEYAKYAKYDKEVEYKENINTIPLEINDDDTIDYIKKKLSANLYKKIANDPQMCYYCFSNSNNTNITIKIDDLGIKKKKEYIEEEEDLFGDFSIKKKKKEEDEEDEEEFDFFNDDEDENSDILASPSLGVSPSLGEPQIGFGFKQKGGSKSSKIFVCHNCRKIYFFNGFDIMDLDNNTDIFPFAELFYLWNNNKIIGHSIVNNQKKNIELISPSKNLISPFEYIKKINTYFLGIFPNKGREVIKNKELINLLQNIVQQKKTFKYFKNNTFLLYKNYEIKNNVINLSYLPELSLYKKNKIPLGLDLYSKLYWPYINFKYYHLKFIQKNLKAEVSSSIIEKSVPKTQNKYNLESYLIAGNKEEQSEGLFNQIETSEKVMIEFEKLKELEKNKYEEFTNKIFYKINDNNNTNILINFNNILHLFNLDEDTPYLSSYISEESIILIKMFKPLENELKLKDWVLNNRNIIQFKLLLPKDIFDDDIKHYFQVNLYENLKIEVSISIPTELMKYISQKKLLKINEKVNNLIKKLNNETVFFNFDEQIPLSNKDFKNWNKEKEFTKINSMNFYLKIKSKVNKKNIDDIIGNLASINNSNGCMREYFYRDFNIKINNYRYKRINNVDVSEITDRFIYNKYKTIIDEDKVGLTDSSIFLEIIQDIMNFFNKTEEESTSIFENYKFKYKLKISQESINRNIQKPSNFGLLFNIKEPEEWQESDSEFYNYKITLMGMRDYQDWEKIKSFILKLFNLIESIESKNKVVDKFIDICGLKKIESSQKDKIDKIDIIKYQQEKSKCKIQQNTLKEDKKMDYNKKQKQNDKLKKRIKALQKLILDKEKQMKKYGTIDYIKRLREHYPNLELYCEKCGISQDSGKECHICNQLLEKTDYTTTCGKYKQPMGTGPGYVPEIIDFYPKVEEDKLKDLDNITCKINQEGGNGSLSLDIYKDWGINNKPEVYKKKMNIKSCNYKKSDLLIIAKLYNIDKSITKVKDICAEILKIVSSGEKESSNEYLNYLKEILKEEKNQDNIKILNFLIEYYSRNYNNYNLSKKEDINKIIQDLKIKIDINSSIKDKKQKILDDLLKIFQKDYEINEKKYIDFFDLEKSINEFKKISNNKNIIKKIIFYNIYKLTDIWKENHIKKIFGSLTGLPTINKKKKEILIELNKIFENFVSKTLKLREILDFDEEEEEKEEKEQIDTEQNLEEKSLNKDGSITNLSWKGEDIEMLLKKNKYNSVIKSVIKFRGKALTCPNFKNYDHPSGNKEFLIGFQDFSNYRNKYNFNDDKLRNLLCKPCCFGSKKDKKNNLIFKPDYTRNVLFCKGKIEWSEYLERVENEQRIENYISTNEEPNKNNTFGKLPKLLHNFFNNYEKLYNKRNNNEIEPVLFNKFSHNLLKSPGFVLKGTKQFRNVILKIFANLLHFTNLSKYPNITKEKFNIEQKKEEIIYIIEKKLKSNSNIFKSLNAGKLQIRFQTIDKYIAYLKGDIIDIRWFFDIISIPNLFKKYSKGFNIIILKEMNKNIKIKPYEDINFEDYYNINKNHLFIYEYSSKELEPIVLKFPGKKIINFLSLDDKNLEKHKINIDYMNNFIKFNKEFIIYSFKPKQKIPITNLKMLKILDDTKYKFKAQIIDNFNKSLFIVTQNNELIPVNPSKIDYNKKTEIIENVENLNKYLKNLNDTIKFIKKFAKDIGNNNYDFEERLILDENRKIITGIQLENKLMLPIKPQKYNEEYLKSEQKLFYEINNALYKKTEPEVDIDFIKEKYDFELYQRLLLEFSNYISKMGEDKKIILKLDKEEVKAKIIEIFNKILIFKEPETINYNKFLKYAKKENIRQLCNADKNKNIKQDFFCNKDINGEYKLVIPLNKRNMFTGILLETLLNKEQQRTKILNDNINTIINIKNFIDDEQHIFIRKEPNFPKEYYKT